MNSLTRIGHLYEVIQSSPMQRKILLTASNAQGHQWLEQVARQYGPVLNTEVMTPESWVLERLKLILARNKVRYVSGLESKWIVCKLIQGMTGAAASYLTGMTLTPGLLKAFHHAVMELRGARVRADQLMPEHFENEQKGLFVKALLGQYERELMVNKLADLAALLPYAEQLRRAEDCIVVDEGAVRDHAVRSLLEALTAGGCIPLFAEQGFTSPNSAFPAETAELFHALGPMAEVREVIRRITEKDIPWDQVEIIASDYDKSAAAVYTIASMAQIRCTFSGGLPIGITNAGKAAKLYLEWLKTGYRVDCLLSGLKQGIIRLRDQEREDIPTANVIRELERSGIGWGRERYKLLESMPDAKNMTEDQARVLRMLRRVFERLFHPLTDTALASPEKLINTVIDFVETYAVVKNEGDVQVLNGLKNLAQSLNRAGELTMDCTLALRHVREAVEELRIHTASKPSPGRIHVTSLASGGNTGRPCTFIVGMTETNWSVSTRQDPVLLDEERSRISPYLLQSRELMKLQKEERDSRIGLIRGSCTLSYCSYDIAENQEKLPAYEMLQVFRRKKKQEEADYETMKYEMGEAVRFYGGTADLSMNAAEAWMRSLVTDGSRIKAGQAGVYSYYSSLMDGKKAEQSRLALECSAYDGIVDTDTYPMPLPGDTHPASAFSAGKLELYGRCPLQFFYQEILGVRVQEAAVYDRTKWLDAMQRGSLLHEIFNRYLMSLKEACLDGSESLHHDQFLLNDIMEREIGRFAEEVPATRAASSSCNTCSLSKPAHLHNVPEPLTILRSVPLLRKLLGMGTANGLIITPCAALRIGGRREQPLLHRVHLRLKQQH
ncbi:PD-(D/E)XK nuclease family protein [Paenibacillus filicis]|uniref:PD-(D/E)XK nuclease family protein n=1 Tax=Paenibacillus gyeongsangnamensis TaxID=3388067 RepID=A0ABT4QDN0_9BACL|nr:PD-(D/E)XK nuclease family protein [Paenibacillus filicis]MCZ8514988.1 PD-(D/E)XK nuclease family protein [Paenibacillus filicis]